VPYRHVNTEFRNEYRMTKEIDAFGLRSLSYALTLSALVKPPNFLSSYAKESSSTRPTNGLLQKPAKKCFIST